MKKATAIIGTLIGVLIVASLAVFVKFVYPRYIEPGNTYSKAAALYNSGDYQRAAMTFSILTAHMPATKGQMQMNPYLKALMKHILSAARLFMLLIPTLRKQTLIASIPIPIPLRLIPCVFLTLPNA